MAKLTILEFPDPRLRTRATPVAVVDDGIRRLLDDMLETMYAAPGVGLAATQVDVHKRVLVADVSKEQDHPLVFVNPDPDAGPLAALRALMRLRSRCHSWLQPGTRPYGMNMITTTKITPSSVFQRST
mgnify:CR=1 FL=1